MARTTLTDRRAKLAEKQRQITEQLKTLDARAKAQERKEETRRKVIAGALALRHAELNPASDFARQMSALIASEIATSENEKTRETLRKLFAGLLPELPPQGATPPAQASAQTDAASALTVTETPQDKSNVASAEAGQEPNPEPQPYRFDTLGTYGRKFV